MSTQKNLIRPRGPGQSKEPGRHAPNLDPVLVRTQHLRRHGLAVTDRAPNMISIFLDIPQGENSVIPNPSPVQVPNPILYAIKLFIDEVDSRLRTQELCNPHNPPLPSYSRIMITTYSKKETPFGVYQAIREDLTSLQETLTKRDARGEILNLDENWRIYEGELFIEWVKDGVPSEVYYNSPVPGLP